MTTSPPATRGPSRLFLHLLPSLVLAVFVTVVFSWNPFGKLPKHAYFEAVVKSPQAGVARFRPLMEDSALPGNGIISLPVSAGQPVRLRFQIPAGRLRSFIFSPSEGGEADLLRCWLASEAGEVVQLVSPIALHQSNPQRVELLPNGALRFPPGGKGGISGVQYTPATPIDLAVAPLAPLWQSTLVFVFALAGWTSLSLLWGERLASALVWRRLATWAHRRPLSALLCVAVAGATLCCFPVIFCGKSFVSPDNGVELLYPGNPSVPGATGGRVDNVIGSDMGATMYWHLPVSMIQHRALFQDGEFPLWNRYHWGGLTLLGQSISMIGDPLDWLAIFTGGASWAWDAKFVIALILFSFGVGILVWRSTRSLPSALLLTLSAPFMGFFAYRYCHAAYFSLCYSPWILLAWVEGARAPTLRRAACWAGFVIFANWWELNSGTAKESSALLLFLNFAGGLVLLLSPETWGWRGKRLAVFAWANVLFLLLSAPLWGTFLDALSKAFTVYEQARSFQMAPGLFIGLFDDLFHRQLMPLEMLFNPSTNFFVLLGTVWVIARARSLAHERLLLAVALPAVAAAALAFGVISPSLVAVIPFFKNIYHLDNTFSCVLFILLFVIAGFGLRECLRRLQAPGWTGDWMVALAVVGVLLASYFGFTQAAHRVGRTFLLVGDSVPLSPFFSGYVVALVAALAILPWAVRSALLRQPAAFAWALVAVAAFATLHFRHGMYLDTRFDYYTRNPKTRLDLRHLGSPALDTVRAGLTAPGRVIGLGPVMLPGFSSVLGFETISGPDALMNPAMIDLTGALSIPRVWGWRSMVKEEEVARLHRALDFLNVRFYLAPPGAAPIPETKLLGSFDLAVLESETAWPRAFFTDAVEVYETAPDLARLVAQGDGRPFAAVLPKQRAGLSLPVRDPAARVVQPAHGYRLTNNKTTFEIDAPSPGLAVLLETYVPGDIVAFVDGQPAPALRVNHAFRGVVIDQPGHHVVEFSYWPAVLDATLGLSALGLVGLLLSGWVLWRGRPSAAPSPQPAEPSAALSHP